MQFSLYDSSNPAASPTDTYQKLKNVISAGDDDDYFPSVPSSDSREADQDDLDVDADADKDEEASDSTEDPNKLENVERRRKRHRLARLRRKSLAARAYQFSGTGSGVQGIVFMEILKVIDLPPEKNGMERLGSPLRSPWLT